MTAHRQACVPLSVPWQKKQTKSDEEAIGLVWLFRVKKMGYEKKSLSDLTGLSVKNLDYVFFVESMHGLSLVKS